MLLIVGVVLDVTTAAQESPEVLVLWLRAGAASLLVWMLPGLALALGLRSRRDPTALRSDPL